MKKKTYVVQLFSIVLLYTTMQLIVGNTFVSSNSEPSINHLSSKPSSSSSYEKFFYHSTNGALPFDREITIYIFSGEAKRLYYQIHNAKPDIALTVTPCESDIKWKLLFIGEKSRKKDRKERPRRRYKRRHYKTVTNNLLNKAKPLLLATYEGSERKTYSNITTLPGLYIIDFNSNGKDISVKLFVSQHYPYPLLPNEPNIHISNINNDRVLINWNSSPSEAVSPVEYCIAMSSKRHFIDNCQLDVHSKENDEEYELDLLPSAASTSFAYWWGKTVKNLLRQSKVESIADQNLRIECIGRKTWYLITNLKNRVNYFIDVFAKNSITNATSMYSTINITLINNEPIIMKENEQTIVKLGSDNGHKNIFKYRINTQTEEKLWLFIQSCSGPGPIILTVKTNSTKPENATQIVLTENIFDMKTMEIDIDANVSQTMIIEVSSFTDIQRSAVLLLSRKHNKFPFPRLPNDRKIKVLETLTDCNSVTLAWTASPDDKVLYCIYQREAHNHGSVFPQSKNVCTDIGIDMNNKDIDSGKDGNPARKVLCRRYHKSSKRRFNDMIVQNVKRLNSGSKYVFQVMVTKYRLRTLSYEQIWVSTKSKYQCSH